jgi:hypothetical protein
MEEENVVKSQPTEFSLAGAHPLPRLTPVSRRTLIMPARRRAWSLFLCALRFVITSRLFTPLDYWSLQNWNRGQHEFA